MSEKTLYHQRYSTEFKKHSCCWKMWKIGIWAEKIYERSYFSFAMARWKLLEKGNVKFPHSKLYTLSEKSLYHQRYSTDFQKLSFCCKMWKIGIWAEKIYDRSYFSFGIAMGRWKLFFKKGKMLKFPHFKLYIACQKKCYITKGIQPILKNFPAAERCGK